MANHYRFQRPDDDDESLGGRLENELVDICADWFRANNDAAGFKCMSGTISDIQQGTDATIWRVPVDFTCDFSGKDNCVKLPSEVTLEQGVTVLFGFRTGNSHHGYTKFEQPVLVIGLRADQEYLSNWMGHILDKFHQKMKEIIETGQKDYWDYFDSIEA